MWLKMIDEYLEEHNSAYKSQYTYYSCDRIEENTFKFHYYLLNQQLLQIDLFFTVTFEDVIEVKIKDGLLEYERNALVIDGLKRIRKFIERPSHLNFKEVMAVCEGELELPENTMPQDIIYIFNYIMYHLGKNPDEIYHFYKIYFVFIKRTIANEKYKDMMASLHWLLDEILYEREVVGVNIKYLDQEYMMHQAYFRSIYKTIEPVYEIMYLSCKNEFVEIYGQLFTYWRFAFSIYTTLVKQAYDHSTILRNLLMTLDETEKNEGLSLLINLLYLMMDGESTGTRQMSKQVISLFISDIKTYVNSEEQKDSALFMLNLYGYDILLELFEESYDSFIFTSIPIHNIPVDLKPYIKEALERGLIYYADLIKGSQYNPSAINQIANINHLLLQYF